MSKPTPLSGFPELLPAARVVERQVVDSLSRTFELHGFANIETRAVEPLDRLAKGGEIDKEIYVLRRLQAGEGDSDAGLALHFDLTVPFARYVLEHVPCERHGQVEVEGETGVAVALARLEPAEHVDLLVDLTALGQPVQ